MVTAVITGASSGLGKEYINAIIAEYPTVDVFWLVARRKELLKEIADEHPDKTIAAISLDLSQEESLEIFEKLLKENEPEIKVLVNNAGFGKCGVGAVVQMDGHAHAAALAQAVEHSEHLLYAVAAHRTGRRLYDNVPPGAFRGVHHSFCGVVVQNVDRGGGFLFCLSIQ